MTGEDRTTPRRDGHKCSWPYPDCHVLTTPELTRLRAIEEAARAFVMAFRTERPVAPDSPLAALRAALEGAPHE